MHACVHASAAVCRAFFCVVDAHPPLCCVYAACSFNFPTIAALRRAIDVTSAFSYLLEHVPLLVAVCRVLQGLAVIKELKAELSGDGVQLLLGVARLR